MKAGAIFFIQVSNAGVRAYRERYTAMCYLFLNRALPSPIEKRGIVPGSPAVRIGHANRADKARSAKPKRSEVD
jgi:hypothetical protein